MKPEHALPALITERYGPLLRTAMTTDYVIAVISMAFTDGADMQLYCPEWVAPLREKMLDDIRRGTTNGPWSAEETVRHQALDNAREFPINGVPR